MGRQPISGMRSSDPSMIGITAGEPAGIGPELVALLAARHRERPYPMRLVVLGDRDVLRTRAERIGIAADYIEYEPKRIGARERTMEIWHHPVAVPVTPGQLDPANAASVLATLVHGCDACATGAFAALVTAPVQKSVLMDAGIPFSGHTEFFA